MIFPHRKCVSEIYAVCELFGAGDGAEILSIFGSRKYSPDMVVNFIVAAIIERFRKYEEMCADTIKMMPLHVAGIFSEVFGF